jgi:protein-S-isoprenylcysteine O-methyltransferase Ste14
MNSPGISVFTPPRIFLACLVGGLVAEALLPTGFAPFGMIFWPLRWIAGMAIVGGGFVFMMWGHNRFTAVGTPVKTRLPAKELVMGAAYRVSRNPMYVGFVVILAGVGVAANSLPIVLSAFVMFLFLDRYVIPREERYLRQRFGGDYEAYCRKARRWL